MEKITIYVSRQDFADAQRFGLKSPLLMALQRWTGTLWRLHDGGCLLEVMSPFRACQLSPVLMQTLDEYGQSENLYPIIVELELQTKDSNDGYAVRQQTSVETPQVQQIHSE